MSFSITLRENRMSLWGRAVGLPEVLELLLRAAAALLCSKGRGALRIFFLLTRRNPLHDKAFLKGVFFYLRDRSLPTTSLQNLLPIVVCLFAKGPHIEG